MKETLVSILDDIQESGTGFQMIECHGRNYPDTIRNEDVADHLIENGVTVQRWIPVEERLPAYGEEVIVYAGNYLKGCVTALRFWRAEDRNWVGVTHWMHLPEPPGKE